MERDSRKNKYQHTGAEGALSELVYQLANRLVYFEALHGMILQPKDIDPRYLQPQVGYDMRFLTPDEVRIFARDPANELSHDVVGPALLRGDRCFGILDRDILASYGWYATKPTRVTDEFMLHFDGTKHVYMHHGFTRTAYRGRRLHAIGMGRALKALSDEGCEGLVSIVSGKNVESLRSTRRLGYRDIGNVYMIGRFGRYIVHTSAGWRNARMSLVPLMNVKAHYVGGSQVVDRDHAPA